jgi:hypothetical protein
MAGARADRGADSDGKTIGLHYGGQIGSMSTAAPCGPMVAAPGQTQRCPLAQTDVTEQRSWNLSRVKTVQRINTKGGAMQGSCETAGTYRSVPYSADFVFLH